MNLFRVLMSLIRILVNEKAVVIAIRLACGRFESKSWLTEVVKSGSDSSTAKREFILYFLAKLRQTKYIITKIKDVSIKVVNFNFKTLGAGGLVRGRGYSEYALFNIKSFLLFGVV